MCFGCIEALNPGQWFNVGPPRDPAGAVVIVQINIESSFIFPSARQRFSGIKQD